MSKYLEKLRKSNNLETTKKLIQEEEQKFTSFGDSRFWKLPVDKTGNGEAVIRFLGCDPEKPEETSPFVSKEKHFFKGKTLKIYAENCPKTIGKDCPVCDGNIEVNMKYKDNKELAKKINEGRYPKKNFYANIYVVECKARSEDEGKVFLFEFGPKIFEKIKEANAPTSARKKAIDAFSIFDDGANFVMIAKTDNKQRNYDSSFFEDCSFLTEDEKKMEEIMKSTYSLQSIISEENFKSYDELEKILERVDTLKRGGSHKDEDEDEINKEEEKNTEIDISDVDIDDLPF